MKNKIIFLGVSAIFLLLFVINGGVALAATEFDVQNDPSSYDLEWGESINPNYKVTCQNSLWACDCQVLCPDSSCYQSIGRISTNDYREFSTCSYSAPYTGKDEVDFEIKVACTDSLESGYTQKTKNE